jgi:endonuclease YncB( thermonuclease family)
MKVRLAGTIVPQGPRIEAGQGQTYNRRAREYLTELIKGKVVDVKAYGLDERDRILAEVYFGELNINLEMIRAGMAIVDRAEPPAALDLQPYFRAEEEARDAQQGVWRTFSLTPNRRVGTKP